MLGSVKHTILFGLLIINLSGCVGYYQTKSSGPVEKDMTLALWLSRRMSASFGKANSIRYSIRRNLSTMERALPLGTMPIGQKDQKQDSIIKEIKIYNDKTRWCGRTVWAIIPIPLLSRSCRTYTELTFENGEPVSARERYLERTGHICSPFVPMMKISKAPLAEGFCREIRGDRVIAAISGRCT